MSTPGKKVKVNSLDFSRKDKSSNFDFLTTDYQDSRDLNEIEDIQDTYELYIMSGQNPFVKWMRDEVTRGRAVPMIASASSDILPLYGAFDVDEVVKFFKECAPFSSHDGEFDIDFLANATNFPKDFLRLCWMLAQDREKVLKSFIINMPHQDSNRSGFFNDYSDAYGYVLDPEGRVQTLFSLGDSGYNVYDQDLHEKLIPYEQAEDYRLVTKSMKSIAYSNLIQDYYAEDNINSSRQRTIPAITTTHLTRNFRDLQYRDAEGTYARGKPIDIYPFIENLMIDERKIIKGVLEDIANFLPKGKVSCSIYKDTEGFRTIEISPDFTLRIRYSPALERVSKYLSAHYRLSSPQGIILSGIKRFSF